MPKGSVLYSPHGRGWGSKTSAEPLELLEATVKAMEKWTELC